MKKVITCMLMMSLAITVLAVADRKDPAYRRAVTDGAQAQICVKVIDDDGRPVPQVNVMAVIAMRFSEYQQRGQTDTNGCFVVEGKTTGNYIELWAEKEGYYKSKKKLILVGPEHAHEVNDGKWQPYGVTEKIVLRQKGEQKQRIVYRQFHLPSTNAWIGVDMKVCDLISPLGTGSFADFEVNVQWDGLPSWKSRFCKMKVHFLQRDSGFYWEKDVLESCFPYSYCADEKHPFSTTFEYVNREDGVSGASREFGRTHHWVVRSRCVHSSKGELLSAHYGSVICLEVGPSRTGKPLFSLGTVFNPVPNDLNLEPAER